MMMKKLDKKASEAYKVDMSSIKEDESFQCPKCGMTISPDDESGDSYQIIDTKVDGNDDLAELTIVCGKCRSTIKVTT